MDQNDKRGFLRLSPLLLSPLLMVTGEVVTKFFPIFSFLSLCWCCAAGQSGHASPTNGMAAYSHAQHQQRDKPLLITKFHRLKIPKKADFLFTLMMPTIHREDGFRFFFYSNEGNEPIHTHIEKGNAEGKIWLEPVIEIESMYGFTSGEVKRIMSIVEQNLEYFKKAWHEYFNT